MELKFKHKRLITKYKQHSIKIFKYICEECNIPKAALYVFSKKHI